MANFKYAATVPSVGYDIAPYGSSPKPQSMNFGAGYEVPVPMIGASGGVGFNSAPNNLSGSSMNPPDGSFAPITSPRPKDNPNITNPAAGDAAKTGGFFGADGFNIGDVGTIADVIGTFGSIWGGIQANKIAKEEMALQKQAYQTNLASSISSYNLAIEDRMRARYAQNERSDAEASAYIAANQLKA